MTGGLMVRSSLRGPAGESQKKSPGRVQNCNSRLEGVAPRCRTTLPTFAPPRSRAGYQTTVMLRQLASRAARQVSAAACSSAGVIPAMGARAMATSVPATTDEAWAKLYSRVHTDDGRRQIDSLKKELRDSAAKFEKECPSDEIKIDWDAYRSESNHPELFTMYEDAVKKLKIPEVEGAEEEMANITKEFAKVQAEYTKSAAAAKVKGDNLKIELAKVSDQKARVETITMDEIFEAEPELRKIADDRIRNDIWF